MLQQSKQKSSQPSIKAFESREFINFVLKNGKRSLAGGISWKELSGKGGLIDTWNKLNASKPHAQVACSRADFKKIAGFSGSNDTINSTELRQRLGAYKSCLLHQPFVNFLRQEQKVNGLSSSAGMSEVGLRVATTRWNNKHPNEKVIFDNESRHIFARVSQPSESQGGEPVLFASRLLRLDREIASLKLPPKKQLERQVRIALHEEQSAVNQLRRQEIEGRAVNKGFISYLSGGVANGLLNTSDKLGLSRAIFKKTLGSRAASKKVAQAERTVARAESALKKEDYRGFVQALNSSGKSLEKADKALNANHNARAVTAAGIEIAATAALSMGVAGVATRGLSAVAPAIAAQGATTYATQTVSGMATKALLGSFDQLTSSNKFDYSKLRLDLGTGGILGLSNAVALTATSGLEVAGTHAASRYAQTPFFQGRAASLFAPNVIKRTAIYGGAAAAGASYSGLETLYGSASVPLALKAAAAGGISAAAFTAAFHATPAGLRLAKSKAAEFNDLRLAKRSRAQQKAQLEAIKELLGPRLNEVPHLTSFLKRQIAALENPNVPLSPKTQVARTMTAMALGPMDIVRMMNAPYKNAEVVLHLRHALDALNELPNLRKKASLLSEMLMRSEGSSGGRQDLILQVEAIREVTNGMGRQPTAGEISDLEYAMQLLLQNVEAMRTDTQAARFLGLARACQQARTNVKIMEEAVDTYLKRAFEADHAASAVPFSSGKTRLTDLSPSSAAGKEIPGEVDIERALSALNNRPSILQRFVSPTQGQFGALMAAQRKLIAQHQRLLPKAETEYNARLERARKAHPHIKALITNGAGTTVDDFFTVSRKLAELKSKQALLDQILADQPTNLELPGQAKRVINATKEQLKKRQEELLEKAEVGAPEVNNIGQKLQDSFDFAYQPFKDVEDLISGIASLEFQIITIRHQIEVPKKK